jgi:hypothetical protein
MAVIKKAAKGRESLMDDMDSWSKILVKTLVPPLLASKPVSDEMLVDPGEAGKHTTVSLFTGDTEFKNLAKDTTCGNFPFGQWAALTFTQRGFDVKDVYLSIAEDDVKPLLKETKLDQILAKPNVPFEFPTRDEGLTRQGFYGLGSHRLMQVEEGKEKGAPENAIFKVDLMIMKDLEVRPGFAKYGACVYYDQDQNPLAIRTANESLVYPDDGYKWEVAKFAWRSSLITLVTAVDHLYNLHFACAAQMLRACTEAFPADHPIKRALHPFTMRTALINNKAGTALLPKHSILHHITAFRWGALCELAAGTYQKGPEWQCLKTTVATKGSKVQELIASGKLPFYQDGLELYEIFFSFFERVVPSNDAEVANDAAIQTFWKLLVEYTRSSDLKNAELSRSVLLETLATFCFNVTAGHEQVGAIAEHMETPLHGGFRMTHNAVQVDKQSYLGGSLLLAMTSIATPPLQSKFAKYWKGNEEATSWQTLQGELVELAERVDERNKTRKYCFQAANPRFLECAVSV